MAESFDPKLASIEGELDLAAKLTRSANSNFPLISMGKNIGKYVTSTNVDEEEEARRHLASQTPDNLSDPLLQAQKIDDKLHALRGAGLLERAKFAAADLSTVKVLLREPDLNPETAADMLDEVTAKEWRDWLPEMLWDYFNIKEDDVQPRDKIMAVQVGLTNPDAFSDWKVFLACCIAFNHRRVNFEWMDKPSYIECAWACEVLKSMQPTQVFAPEVIRFIGSVMLEDGVAYFPWIGGDGILLGEGDNGKWAKGLIEESVTKLGTHARAAWESGDIQHLEPSEVDDENAEHVQLAKLVNAQAYIRAQRPRTEEAGK